MFITFAVETDDTQPNERYQSGNACFLNLQHRQEKRTFLRREILFCLNVIRVDRGARALYTSYIQPRIGRAKLECNLGDSQFSLIINRICVTLQTS